MGKIEDMSRYAWELISRALGDNAYSWEVADSNHLHCPRARNIIAIFLRFCLVNWTRSTEIPVPD